ncbi:MAG: dTDP-4-dehydrorhamnose reductase [Verrucomicrobiales bacterium]
MSTPNLLIIGAGGRLGGALCRHFFQHSFRVLPWTRHELELSALEALQEKLQTTAFDTLINCAAFTNVDQCESDRELAETINALAPKIMAEECAKKQAQCIHISTDYVFDGTQEGGYKEDDQPHPLSHYGATKLLGERLVHEANPKAWVIRVSWVFGPDRPSFIEWILDQALQNESVQAIGDKWSAPSYTMDLARWLQVLLEHQDGGTLHMANSGFCSWQTYGQEMLNLAYEYGLPVKTKTVDFQTLAEMKKFVAQRPIHTGLCNEKLSSLLGHPPRTWQDALADYFQQFILPRFQRTGRVL